MSNVFDTNTIDLDTMSTRIVTRKADAEVVDQGRVQEAAVEGIINKMMPSILNLARGESTVGYIRDEDQRVFLNYSPNLVGRVARDEITDAAFWDVANREGRDHLRRAKIGESLDITHERIVSPKSGDHGWKITVTRRA